MSESNNTNLFYIIHVYIHYIARMSKFKNNHCTVACCIVDESFYLKVSLLVTQNGSIRVVLFPLQTENQDNKCMSHKSL